MLAERNDEIKQKFENYKHTKTQLTQIRKRTERIIDQIEQEKKDQAIMIKQLMALYDVRDKAMAKEIKSKKKEALKKAKEDQQKGKTNGFWRMLGYGKTDAESKPDEEGKSPEANSESESKAKISVKTDQPLQGKPSADSIDGMPELTFDQVKKHVSSHATSAYQKRKKMLQQIENQEIKQMKKELKEKQKQDKAIAKQK